jgi:hypothetical protein
MKIRKFLKFTFVTLILLIVGLSFVHTFNMRNPFSDVQWIEDYPGATERYVTYTPVLKADNSIKLGPTVGADYAKLRFIDINNDGTKEVIIETEILFDWGEFYSAEKHVLQYRKSVTGAPEFILIKSEEVPGDDFGK